jgi:hypothetical protein
MVNRALTFLAVVLVALAFTVFIKLRSVPSTKDFVQNEISTLSAINSDLFQTLKLNALEVIKQGKGRNQSSVKEAVERAKLASVLVDSINVWINTAISQKKKFELTSKLSTIEDTFDYTTEEIDFGKDFKALINDIKNEGTKIDFYLTSLALENNRYQLFEFISIYLNYLMLLL